MASRLLRLHQRCNYTITIPRSNSLNAFIRSNSSSTLSDSISDSSDTYSEKQSNRTNSPAKKIKSKKPLPKKLVPPKRPMNVMQLVTQDVISKFKQESGKLSKEDARDCFRIAAETYRSLSDADRKNYTIELDRRREEYEIEMREFLDSLTPDDYVNQKEYMRRRKAQGRSATRKGIPKLDPNAPKRPMNGFMIFCSELRSNPSKIPGLANQLQAAEKDGKPSVIEGSKILANYWRSMDEDLKQEYLSEGQRRSDLYKEEKAKYDLRCNPDVR